MKYLFLLLLSFNAFAGYNVSEQSDRLAVEKAEYFIMGLWSGGHCLESGMKSRELAERVWLDIKYSGEDKEYFVALVEGLQVYCKKEKSPE